MTKAEQCLTIYKAYPKHKARATAVKAIEKSLKKINYAQLLVKTKAYAKHVQPLRNTERWKWIPHPTTWFNGECWDDDFDFEPIPLEKEDTTKWGQSPTNQYGHTERFREDLIWRARKANPSLQALSDKAVYERWLLANGYELGGGLA